MHKKTLFTYRLESTQKMTGDEAKSHFKELESTIFEKDINEIVQSHLELKKELDPKYN